ncbi:cupredoxin domain-containing protein [Kocuria sp. CPCC 205292]|uniref:cupredoxin domain-containing protein n=1 Tax=Kocuria cellulosilytica TaxID=3071451 RepID=UPI0034D3E770
MNLTHGITAVALVAALAGATGCAARSGPAGEAPEAPAPSAPAPGSEARSSAAQPAEEPVITVEDFAYELPDSVAPGATVTVINEGEATHTVTAQDAGTFDAVVAGGGTTTFTAPDEPGEYPIACSYHPEMSGTLVVE